LWFFIILSPLFPILLLFYPVRNTGKIWIGEFFRWVMYAPLFAVFLSGLVKLWSAGLPLIFNFTGAARGDQVYPTAINILLGGPGQHIGINNSVNLPDTFALYLVALIMLWAVIILPFILLQIFLDHMMAYNYQNNPIAKQMLGLINNRLVPPPKPLGPTYPVGPSQPAGLARNLPIGRRFGMPTTAGLAKQIPMSQSQSQYQQQTVQRPALTRISNKSVVSNLTNLSIPTMRDIARLETTKLSRDTRATQEISRVKETLRQIGNPISISSTERDRFQLIRERLRIEMQKGNSVASNVLNAATTYNNLSTQKAESTVISNSQQLIQNIARPEKIESRVQREKITQIKEQLVQAANKGNFLAQTIVKAVTSYSTSQVNQLQSILQNIAHPEKVSSTTERQSYSSLREKIVTASKSGNQMASLLMTALEKSKSPSEVKLLHDQLLQAQAQGSPLAQEILKTIDGKSVITQKDAETIEKQLQEASNKGEPLATILLQLLREQKAKQPSAPVTATAKLKSSSFPVINRVQEVSLDDYEAVKKMWKENYQSLEVPQSLSGQQTRKDWITQDISSIEETISLLTSASAEDIQKGMQNVSDILPFLLIGGFSQSEIIAYLKAKAEAGKTVLEGITDKDEEDETLLQVARAAKAVTTGHLTASLEADAQTSAPRIATTNEYNTTINNSSPTINSYQTQSTSPLLKLTQLPLLTMKDIVRFETARRDSSKERVERDRIQSTLHGIAHPESSQTPEERERFTQIREQVIEESKKGNPLASLILSSSSQFAGTSLETQQDTMSFIRTIETVLNPALADQAVSKETAKIHEMFISSRQKADQTTLQIEKVAREVISTQLDNTKEFLQKISNPKDLATASEQMHYSKLIERIKQSGADGNLVANFIVKLTHEQLTSERSQQLFTLLTQAQEQGDQLAAYLTSTLYSLPENQQTVITNLYQQLQTEKASDNSLAAALLRLVMRSRQEQTDVAGLTHTVIPKQNRLQQVTLEDYETVKSMWAENYQSAEPPQTATGNDPSALGTTHTSMKRDEWIKQDIASITETVSLLSSLDEQVVQDGMSKVGEILPFLLLGGFSQSEIIGYLKAKLEAGKAVLQTLEKQTEQEEEDLVKSTKKTVGNKTTQQTVAATIPEEVTSIQRDSYFRLPLPSLKDIASFDLSQNQKAQSSKTVSEITSLLTKLARPEQIQSSSERQEVQVLRRALEQQAQTGDSIAQALLSTVTQSDSLQTNFSAQDFVTTLRKLFDPSLVLDATEREEYIKTREVLTQARQLSDKKASSLIQLSDTISQNENSSVMKLLQSLRDPQTLSSSKERESVQALKETLEKASPQSSVAQTLLKASQQEVTPVIANNVRVSLIESALTKQDSLAEDVLQSFVSMPQTTITQITSLYQQMAKGNATDPLVSALRTLLIKQQQLKQQRGSLLVSLPKKNRMQQVTLDDYQAVEQMLYEMYLHGDVPPDSTGKQQTREEWITSEKEAVEKVINLLLSDVADNVKLGTEMIGDILPFLLLGGFSQDEVISYLKAKDSAATRALQTLSAIDESEQLEVSSTQAKPVHAVAAKQQEVDEPENTQ